MTPKISACIIARDESSTIEDCLKSIRPHVDEIVCVDTGSVDGTPEIARKHADIVEVFLDCNDPQSGLIEDFSLARNRSFELASHEWAFWVDADDIVEGAEHLRRLAASAKADLVQFLFPYDYAFSVDGVCVNRHYRERLMRPRSKLRWTSPVHEGCLLTENPAGSTRLLTHSDLVRVIHRSQQSKKPRETERNLRILKKYVEKNGEGDVRALYYLGLEYGIHGNLGDSMRVLKRYVELAKWDDEKCCALLKLAEHYRAIGDHGTAIEWATKALVEKSWTEPYWALLKSFYSLAVNGVEPEKNFRRAAHFATLGLSLKQDDSPETVLFNNPRARYEAHEYLNVVLSRLGELDDAIASCEEGLKGLPGHEHLTKNLALYRNERSKRTILRESKALVDAGEISEDAANVFEEILKNNVKVARFPQPVDISGEQIAGEMVESALNAGAAVSRGTDAAASGLAASGLDDASIDGGHANSCRSENVRRSPDAGCLDIVFYLGPALERWSPATFEKTGLGGSETMAWELSKRLAKLGHRVRLFGHCAPTMQGVFEGVEYVDSSNYRSLTCDVLIASRRPEAVDDVFRVKSGCRILWVHDIHCGEALNMPRYMRFDRILCLSNWHKEFFLGAYLGIDPNKIIVTRNGIDLSRFEGSETRDTHRAIYSSSPDRGLLTALEVWPRVRAQVPDATLHVFYGFGNWTKIAQLNLAGAQAAGDAEGVRRFESELRGIRHLEHLAKHTEGVFFHDRINQKQLAREFMKSGVWAYPTWFTETSCVTAMEAQAAGLRIVTSPIAALNETVAERGVMIGKGAPDEWRSPEYFEAFTREVVEAMNQDASTERIERDSGHRKWLRQCAKELFCLDKLADEWSAMLTEIHSDVSEKVVPAFVEVA